MTSPPKSVFASTISVGLIPPLPSIIDGLGNYFSVMTVVVEQWTLVNSYQTFVYYTELTWFIQGGTWHPHTLVTAFLCHTFQPGSRSLTAQIGALTS